MPSHKFLDITSGYQRLISILGILIGTAVGLMAGAVPKYLIVAIVAMAAIVCTIYFVNSFEQVILGFLTIRSSLDVFSSQQIPALIAIGVDLVTLVYIAMLLLSKQKVQLDGFWCFLAGWIALQALWVILLPLGGLGLDASVLSISIREWVRMFSWLMVYLLIMQFKDRLHPEKVISALFLSLIVPLVAALLQIVFPPSMLPSFLVFESGYSVEAGSRINGTLGHPNTFATFLLLFLGLALWKINSYPKRRYWIILVAVLAFFLVSTNSLTGMMMLVAFMVAYFIPRFNAINLIAGLCLLAIIGFLFVSSDLGQERLQSLYETPLLNPDIDWSRAILMQWEGGNSFNWRIAQWTYLLQSWEQYPIWGYGLGTAAHISVFDTAAHNDYIRFLVEEGIVGFTAFLAFLLAQFANLLRLIFSVSQTSTQRNLCSMMLAYFAAILVGMLTGNLLIHTTMFFYWWTLMAIAGWNWKPSGCVAKTAML
ncbi:MAG: O-antigen ligase family protein [Xenococcaceae cyanobacterium]